MNEYLRNYVVTHLESDAGNNFKFHPTDNNLFYIYSIGKKDYLGNFNENITHEYLENLFNVIKIGNDYEVSINENTNEYIVIVRTL